RRRHTRFSRDSSSDVCSSDRPLDAGAVVDGIQEAGNQIDWLIQGETTHVLPEEMRFRAADGRSVQHGLIDVEPAALESRVDEMRSEERRVGNDCGARCEPYH